MGDEPSPPPAPDYAASAAAGQAQDIAGLPAERQIDQAAILGQKGSVYIPGYGSEDYDFTGLGDAATTDAQTQTALDMLNKYGSQFVDKETALTNEADPSRAALNSDYENTVKNQLDLGGQLDPSVARQVQQSALGGQAARGNVLGDADAFSQAMSTGTAAEQLQQQRTANAQATLGLAPVSSQFGNINQATAPIASSQYAGPVANPNAAQQAAQFALGEYGTQSQNYQNAPSNPWMTLAGTAIGTAVGTAAHAM